MLRRETRKIVNRAATAFRIAASTLRLSDSYLGAQFRRFRGKLGAPKAITAMAHKLAVLFYRMLRLGQEYVDRGQSLRRPLSTTTGFSAEQKGCATRILRCSHVDFAGYSVT